MQYAILILLILAVILLLILMFHRSRNLINAMEQQILLCQEIYTQISITDQQYTL